MANEIGPIGAVLVVGLTMTVVCAWPMYKGWQRRTRYRLVRDTPTESAETAATGETVLLTGPVHTAGETIRAPVTDETGVLAAWLIDEWQDENHQLKYWSPEARGLRTATLQIGAGDDPVTFPARSHGEPTGSTTSLVGYDAVTGFDIDDALVEVDAFETTLEIAQSDDPPARLRALERQIGLDEPDAGVTLLDLGRKHGTRRYRDALLEDGDTATIRGTVRTAETPGDGRVVAPPEDGPLLVSDMTADSLERRYRWAYWKLFYGSVGVILTMMLFAALAIAGG